MEPVQPSATTAKPSAPPTQPPVDKPAPKPPPWMKYLVAIRVMLGSVLAAIGRATRSALGTVGGALLRLLKNLLPDADVLRSATFDDGLHCHRHPPGPGGNRWHRFSAAWRGAAAANLLPESGGEGSLCRYPHQPTGAAPGLPGYPG